MTLRARRFGFLVRIVAVTILATTASFALARPLNSIKARGKLLVCANPTRCRFRAKTASGEASSSSSARRWRKSSA